MIFLLFILYQAFMEGTNKKVLQNCIFTSSIFSIQVTVKCFSIVLTYRYGYV